MSEHKGTRDQFFYRENVKDGLVVGVCLVALLVMFLLNYYKML
jgi:hypothetical protein